VETFGILKAHNCRKNIPHCASDFWIFYKKNSYILYL